MLCSVCTQLWHSHILPLANILLAAAAPGEAVQSLLESSAAEPQFAAAAAAAESRPAAAGAVGQLLLQLKKAVQHVALLMIKCRFNHLRPLAAAGVLLYDLAQRCAHLS